MMRPQRPWGAKLGARGVQEQQSRPRPLLDEQQDQLQRRGVGPMQVFDGHYSRLHLGDAQRPLDQRGEQAAALLLGRQRRGRIFRR